MTLIEVLVAASLAALVLGLFVSFLVPAMRYSGEAAARGELQQQTVMALNQMERDLRQSSRSGLTFVAPTVGDESKPSGFCAVPIKDVTQTGQQVWESGVVLYFWDRPSRRLFRKLWPPAPPASVSVNLDGTSARALTGADFATLVATPNGSEKPIAIGVANFTAAHAGNSTSVVLPVTLDLRLDREVVPGRPPMECHMVRNVVTRNDS